MLSERAIKNVKGDRRDWQNDQRRGHINTASESESIEPLSSRPFLQYVRAVLQELAVNKDRLCFEFCGKKRAQEMASNAS